MSPRKSSTSSANRSHRPRYLGLEVAGVLSQNPRWLEPELRARLRIAPGEPPKLRLIRTEGNRTIVELPHTLVEEARRAWNDQWTTRGGTTITVATRRSFGTLVKGKQWLRAGRRALATVERLPEPTSPRPVRRV